VDRVTADSLLMQITKTNRKQESFDAFWLIHWIQINSTNEGDFRGKNGSIYCEVFHGNFLQINFNWVLHLVSYT
jgi:hypothetical protein